MIDAALTPCGEPAYAEINGVCVCEKHIPGVISMRMVFVTGLKMATRREERRVVRRQKSGYGV